eukprot:760860-Hanusia_phi.AAC.3
MALSSNQVLTDILTVSRCLALGSQAERRAGAGPGGILVDPDAGGGKGVRGGVPCDEARARERVNAPAAQEPQEADQERSPGGAAPRASVGMAGGGRE